MEDYSDEGEDDYIRQKNIILRDYQLTLVEKAKQENSILYLPAGAGKTLIAIHVLNSRRQEIIRPFSKGGKRAFFLATTKVLVYQLFKVLQCHTKFRIACFTGDMNVDAWSHEKWFQHFENNHVLVLTAEILKQVLVVKYIQPSNISLVVFDECHHAVEKHPYRLVLDILTNDDNLEKPLLLGLSAVLLNSNTNPQQISKNIQALEIAFKAKVITEWSIKEVLRFSARPIEKIIIYKDGTEHSVEMIFQLYADAISVLENMVLQLSNSCDVPEEGKEFKNKNAAKRIKNFFVNSKSHFEELGLFMGSLSALFYIILIEKYRLLSTNSNEIQVLIYAVTELNKIRHLAQKVMGVEETEASIFRFSSYKVRQLIDILKEVKKTAKDKHVSILIFVRQRVVAIVLAFFLKRLSQVSSDFSFIKANFVVGSSIFSKEYFFLESKNEDIVKQFGARSLNLLVATNILEEGIDVSNCNVVVSFDFPLLYPSYFQSKGRARNEDSLYYLFLNEMDREKKLSTLEGFRTLEKELFEVVCKKFEITDSEECFFKPVEKIQFATGITVDGLFAIKAVDRYCARLPQDRFSLLSPTSWYKTEGTMKRAYLRLPMNTPLREVITGSPKNSAKEAKMSVYLIALKRLYEMGELDDEFNTKSFETKQCFSHLFSNYKEEKIDKSLPQPGTKRRKQIYRIKFAESLSNCLPRPGAKAYLHVIDLNVAFDKPELHRKIAIYEILRNPVTFAILSTKKLCKIFQFPLFVDMGRINCDFLVNYDEIVLNESEISDIKSCHFALFRKVIRCVKNCHVFDNSNKQHSFFVVPVEKNNAGRFVLSWDLIRSDFCKNSKSALVRYNPTRTRDFSTNLMKKKRTDLRNKMDVEESSTALMPLDAVRGQLLWGIDPDEEYDDRPAFTMTEADYKFFVVIPNYRKQDPPQCYIVNKFCRDMSPLSPFPRSTYEDFVSYYQDKYNIKVTNVKQPLIFVNPLYNCGNFNKPRNRKLRRERDKIKEYEEHLIPELCDVVRFDRRFWVKALLLPTVLNRICHVYSVEEFRWKIVAETGLGIRELPKETDWTPFEVDEVCVDIEDEEGIDGNTSLLSIKSALPLSKLKDETDANPNDCLDPERYLYDCGLCDLEFYVKQLNQLDFEKFYFKFQENDEIIKLMKARTASVPTLKLLQRCKSKKGPELALLVQACTSKFANDIVNFERLETLGDSFLKFATTLYLFRNYTDNEGILTSVKGKMVGNRNLLYCGLAKNVQHVVNVTDFVPLSDWTPPLLEIPERIVESIVSNNVDPAVLHCLEFTHCEQFSGVLSEDTLTKKLKEPLETFENMPLKVCCCASQNEEIILDYEKCYEHPVSTLMPYKIVEDKTISDCVEALIGTYWLTSGLTGAFKFLSWIEVLPKSKDCFSELMETPYEMMCFDSNAIVMNILNEVCYSELEDLLNYHFKNKALLLEALTHPSYFKNRVTNCYQRLEFLGDAVLDVLITAYVYENCGHLTPGQITDIRSSLVNNVTFSCLVVRYELYKYMLFFSSYLSQAIENFVTFQKNRNHVIDDNVLILLEEKNCMIAETIMVPKALGDVFESLAGAIFLDSGNSLETVWNVYYKLMKKELVEFTQTVPKTSVRLLHEICGDKPYYETKVVQKKTRVTCSVFYDNREITGYGFGANKKEGKRSASKVVLNKILKLKK